MLRQVWLKAVLKEDLMKTKPIAFLLFFKATLLTSFSQVLLKIGMKNFDPSIMGILSNMFLIVGIALYGLAAIMVIYGLKNGELSVLYPVIATSYIWVALLAFYFFHEHIDSYKLLGIGAVVAGVVLIGLGGRKAAKDEAQSASGRLSKNGRGRAANG
jgi:drug/metabolite transporter (DMT)-like permease